MRRVAGARVERVCEIWEREGVSAIECVFKVVRRMLLFFYLPSKSGLSSVLLRFMQQPTGAKSSPKRPSTILPMSMVELEASGERRDARDGLDSALF